VKLAHYIETHTGMRRSANEDACGARPDAGLYVVADGMGGHKGGEVASHFIVDRFLHAADAVPPEELAPGFLQETLDSCNAALNRMAEGDEDLKGMGATVEAALFRDGLLHLAHVGDSRAYLLRGDEMRRLTSDHSWLGQQVRLGLLTAEEARNHPKRSRVNRAVGRKPSLAIDVVTEQLQPGDRVLLCSDGLTDVVGDETIKMILGIADSAEECGAELIAEANRRGSPDNVTVCVVEVLETGAPVPGGSGRRPGRNYLRLTLAGLIVLALLVFGGLASIRFRRTPSESVQRRVLFTGDLAGATVTVDGLQHRATAEGVTLALGPGRHVVTVMRPGFRPFRRILQLEPTLSEEPYEVPVTFTPVPKPIGEEKQTSERAAAPTHQEAGRPEETPAGAAPQPPVDRGLAAGAYVIPLPLDDRRRDWPGAAGAVSFTVARDGSYRILLDGKNVMPPLRLKAGDHEVMIIEEEAEPAATETKGAPSSPGTVP